MTLLARRYATALHQAAHGRGAVAAVEGDLAKLHAALADPRARLLFTSPDVTSAERSQIVGRLAGGRHQLIGNLMQTVLRRHRQQVLFDIYPAFRALVLAERGEVEGVIETACPLDAAAVDRLRVLAQQLCGKQVAFAVRVRPELIGGVRLYVGNVLYDGSVQTALEQLERRLLHAAI